MLKQSATHLARSQGSFLGQANRQRGASFLDPRQIFSDAVRVSDILVCTVAGGAGELLYHTAFLHTQGEVARGMGLGAIAGLLLVLIGSNAGNYAFDKLDSIDFQMRKLATALVTVSFIFLATAFLFKSSTEFSRGAILTSLALGQFGLTLARIGFNALVHHMMSGTGILKARVAVVGATVSGTRFLEHCRQHSEDICIIGVFDDGGQGRSQAQSGRQPGLDGTLDDLITAAGTTRIDEIVVALPWSASREIEGAIKKLSVLPVPIKLCPEQVILDMKDVTMSDVAGVPMLAQRSRPIAGWRGIAKALLDISLSAVTLVLASPILVLIAAAIKLDSPGPVFFKQDRHGFNHNIFSVFKFRTMTWVPKQSGSQDQSVAQASRNDARVTRVGRILRKTSLDEVPQLLNVLSGDMSLVGPRPHATAHNREYTKSVDQYAQRHNVKPGLTGWAQVNGLRGETSGADVMQKRVDHDLYYIMNWSFLFDIRIIIQTAFILWFQKDVY